MLVAKKSLVLVFSLAPSTECHFNGSAPAEEATRKEEREKTGISSRNDKKRGKMATRAK